MKDQINNETINQALPAIAKRMLAAVPMVTMIAEHGFRYHFAPIKTHTTYCGHNDYYSRDYVEKTSDGRVRKIGEGGAVFDAINEYQTCKICLAAVKRHCS
jgi:hypothetical protein